MRKVSSRAELDRGLCPIGSFNGRRLCWPARPVTPAPLSPGNLQSVAQRLANGGSATSTWALMDCMTNCVPVSPRADSKLSEGFLPRLSAWVEVGGIAPSPCLKALLLQLISISSATYGRSPIRGCGAGFDFLPGICCWSRCWESRAAARACGIWNALPSVTTLCSPSCWASSSGVRRRIPRSATSSTRWMWRLSALPFVTERLPRSQAGQWISTSRSVTARRYGGLLSPLHVAGQRSLPRSRFTPLHWA